MQKLRKDGITELDFRPISMTRNFLFEINVPTIEEILQCSLNGKLLLEFYAKNGVLNAKHRPILSSCIIDYLIEKKLSPKREHFSAIADNIAQYFKSEDKVSEDCGFLVIHTKLNKHKLM